ncbi:exodeoxyribonuclease VII large subunit [Chelatococcus reniformis]|uniref:Exodeoxyribonuclease 7 large subunit n=1 Tax=Chelatococcus reniformis TaxID=1494448 RepID=A0A916UCM9_9HYPH|nr:exodeoxyribonuclease VII large subunit [Chelatococcus reniformis]GGC67624.1 exodeoxyribonuclease 7 large subunit [Chelatococcus reniformis]
MASLLSEPAAPSNLQEWTVSSLSGALKRALEDQFGYVRLKGEISGYRGQHGSGHCYFSLKDEGAKIDAVIWKSAYAKLKVKPQDGLEVIATGRITTFPGQSKYQIVVETIEPAGLGALMAILEERRRKLAAEGLFAEARKRPIPFLPRTIGVITSPTGAVIRDILHRLADRFPRHVLVWPVRVQGESCAAEVAAAIDGFGALAEGGPIRRPDVIVVARGGGSLEDLWGFNEEIVVRAAARSAIPLVSAVGHETDWTLIDHAADLRCPTPTGAAEKIVPVRLDLVAAIADLARRQAGGVQRHGERRRERLDALARALPRRDAVLAPPRQHLDLTGARLDGLLARVLDGAHRRIARAATVLAGHSPRAELRARRARFDARIERLDPALLQRLVLERRQTLGALGDRLARTRLNHVTAERERLAARQLTLARAGRQLTACWRAAQERRAHRLSGLDQMMRSLSYRGVLARGFALVRDGKGRPLRAAASIAPAMALELQFADGTVAATAGGSARRKPAATSPSTAEAPMLDL